MSYSKLRQGHCLLDAKTTDPGGMSRECFRDPSISYLVVFFRVLRPLIRLKGYSLHRWTETGKAMSAVFAGHCIFSADIDVKGNNG